MGLGTNIVLIATVKLRGFPTRQLPEAQILFFK